MALVKNECPLAERAHALRQAVRETYRVVAEHPAGRFRYPVGRASAVGLGYERKWLDEIPAEVTDHFVGVGNPFGVRKPAPGQAILDVGCGSGLDAFVAALLVGGRGRAIGIDVTPEMLTVPRRYAPSWRAGDVDLMEASVEKLPFDDGSFDMVISNGVLNLVPDKDLTFREIHRVLRPGGGLISADLLIVEELPDDLREDAHAWST